MLQLSNSTPFAATITVLPDTDGVDTVFTIVKGTFIIGRDPTRADEQVPIAMSDAHYGDPATTSIRVPSDICLGKTATDVLLRGSAWSPSGQPIWQMDVSLGVERMTKRARVFGDRVWDVGRGIATPAWVAPFVRMPLVWERAFGGTAESEKGQRSDPRNPIGTGVSSDAVSGRPLPNVEEPTALMSSPAESPPPAGFGPIAAHWEPRRSYAGTYDEEWQTSRAPFVPRDFDRRFFQQAPRGLIMPGLLQGGELVELVGLTPTGDLRFPLPSCRVTVTHRLDDEIQTTTAVMDTVIIEPDEMRVLLVWRSAFRCDKRALRVREIEAALAPMT